MQLKSAAPMQMDVTASGSDMQLDADTGAAMLKLHEETHSTLHVRILEARGLRPREGEGMNGSYRGVGKDKILGASGHDHTLFLRVWSAMPECELLQAPCQQAEAWSWAW